MRRRFYDPGLLHLVSLSTIDRRWALMPKEDGLQSEITGALALAQRQTGVRVHAFAFLSNHYHGLYSFDSAEQFARFLCEFHAATSRLVNRRFGRRGPLWQPRANVKAVLPGEASEQTALQYVLMQACRAGLVDDPREWPGASSAGWLLDGAEVVGRRVRQSERTLLARNGKDPGPLADFTDQVTVVMTPLPCFAGMEAAAWRNLLCERLGLGLALAGSEPQPPPENARDASSMMNCKENTSAAAWHELPVSPPPGRKSASPCIAPTKRAEVEYLRRVKDFNVAYDLAVWQLRRAEESGARGRKAYHVAFPLYAFPPAGRSLPLWSQQNPKQYTE